MMSENIAGSGESEKWAKGLWLVAGIPVIAGLLQGIGAFFEFSWSEQPMFGPVADWLHSFEPFRIASSIAVEQEALIALLFIQVGICWALFGMTLVSRVANYGEFIDGLRSGTAFLIALLYVNLFVGVYWDVVGEVSGASLIIFFSIPFLVLGGIVAAWHLYQPRGPIQDLQRARNTLDNHISTFDNERRQSIKPGLDFLSSLGGGERQIRGINDELDQYRNTLTDLKQDVDDELESPPVSAARAQKLRIQAEEMNPTNRLQDYRARITGSVVDLMKKETGNFSKTSRYGEKYSLVNHPKGPTIYLPAESANRVGKQEVNLGELDQFIDSIVKNDRVSDDELFNLLRALGEKYNTIASDIDEKEETFDDRVQTIHSRLTEFEDALENNFAAPISNELSKIYNPSNMRDNPEHVVTSKSTKEKIRDARDELHDCHFDAAFEILDEAEQTSEDFLLLLEDLERIESQLRRNETSIRLPSPEAYERNVVSQQVLDKLRTAIRKAHNREVNQSNDTLELDYGDVSQTPPTPSGGSTDDSEILIEDAETVLNRIRLKTNQGNEQTDEHAVAVHKDDLTPYLRRDEVLNFVDRFLAQRPEISSSSVSDENEYIEIKTKSGRQINRVLEKLPSKFADWAHQQPNV
jgi:hypothetical protein